jgi:hypothetical protein
MEIKGISDNGGINFFRNIDTLYETKRHQVPEESNLFLNCLREILGNQHETKLTGRDANG